MNVNLGTASQEAAGRCVRGKKAVRRLASLMCVVMMSATAIAAASDPAAEWPLERDIFNSGRLGEVPFGFASWRDLFAEQERLNDAAASVLADPHAAAQLADVIASPAARRLQVYWKGGLEDSTRRLLARLRTRMPVDWHSAGFSRVEMLAASRRALALEEVIGAGPRSDGSGLDITFNPGSARNGVTASLLAKVERVAPGMRLNASVGPAVQFAHSRDDMSLPFYGGGRISDSLLKNVCSLGMPVNFDWAGARQSGWLTAGHCVHANMKSRVHAGSTLIGSVHSRSEGWDVAIIHSTADKLEARVFVGRPAGESAAVPIGSVRTSVTGNVVFSSGSSTGLNGPLAITALDQFVEYDGSLVCAERRDCANIPGYRISSLVRAKHLHGRTAVANGDSGGVAFSFDTDGRAVARGILSQKDPLTKVTCPSDHRMPSGDGNSCTHTLLFADFELYRKVFKVSPLTSNWPR